MNSGQGKAVFSVAANIVVFVVCSLSFGQGFPMTIERVGLAQGASPNVTSTPEKLPSPNQGNPASEPLAVPVAPQHITNSNIHFFANRPVTYSAGCGPTISGANRSAVCPRCGVDEAWKCCCENGRWRQSRPVDFDQFGQGEYIGPPRNHHVPRYRMRVDDQVNLVFRLTRELTTDDYRFQVGDQLRIEREALDDETSTPGFNRLLTVLPDGTITLPLIGRVRAVGRTVDGLRSEIEDKSKTLYKVAIWTVTPETVQARLEDLRNAVDARQGNGGQAIALVVSPDGTIQPPGLGSVCVQGLTLDEAKLELDQRYIDAGFRGIEVTPILIERAPRFVFVLGEVVQPGRFELQGPTTVMQAIALAQGWNIGGKLRQVIVFRRAEDWRLVATQLNLRGALFGRHPTPKDEIFLRDSDIVLVPKSPIQRIDDAINLVFTQGVNELLIFGSAAGIFELQVF